MQIVTYVSAKLAKITQTRLSFSLVDPKKIYDKKNTGQLKIDS